MLNRINIGLYLFLLGNGLWIDLEKLFEDFCNYLNGKLRWKDKSKVWTKTIFKFFTEYKRQQLIPYVEAREHMKVDYIWRRNDPYFGYDIDLAVEHENEVNDIEKLLKEEIRHLIDIKAHNKVGIFYIRSGDEEEFLKKISENIKATTPFDEEKYMIILGYPTWKTVKDKLKKRKKLAILFKAIFFNEKGEITGTKKRVIFQREKSKT